MERIDNLTRARDLEHEAEALDRAIKRAEAERAEGRRKDRDEVCVCCVCMFSCLSGHAKPEPSHTCVAAACLPLLFGDAVATCRKRRAKPQRQIARIAWQRKRARERRRRQNETRGGPPMTLEWQSCVPRHRQRSWYVYTTVCACVLVCLSVCIRGSHPAVCAW